jgi:HEAT repeat protein
MLSAQSLGAIGQHSDDAVPALMGVLKDPSPIVRGESINAFGKFGGHARLAVPALLEAAKNDASLHGNVSIALESINPAAAAAFK